MTELLGLDTIEIVRQEHRTMSINRIGFKNRISKVFDDQILYYINEALLLY